MLQTQQKNPTGDHTKKNLAVSDSSSQADTDLMGFEGTFATTCSKIIFSQLSKRVTKHF